MPPPQKKAKRERKKRVKKELKVPSSSEEDDDDDDEKTSSESDSDDNGKGRKSKKKTRRICIVKKVSLADIKREIKIEKHEIPEDEQKTQQPVAQPLAIQRPPIVQNVTQLSPPPQQTPPIQQVVNQPEPNVGLQGNQISESHQQSGPQQTSQPQQELLDHVQIHVPQYSSQPPQPQAREPDWPYRNFINFNQQTSTSQQPIGQQNPQCSVVNRPEFSEQIFHNFSVNSTHPNDDRSSCSPPSHSPGMPFSNSPPSSPEPELHTIQSPPPLPQLPFTSSKILILTPKLPTPTQESLPPPREQQQQQQQLEPPPEQQQQPPQQQQLFDQHDEITKSGKPRKKRTPKPQAVCPHCTISLYDRYALKRHIIAEHNGEFINEAPVRKTPQQKQSKPKQQKVVPPQTLQQPQAQQQSHQHHITINQQESPLSVPPPESPIFNDHSQHSTFSQHSQLSNVSSSTVTYYHPHLPQLPHQQHHLHQQQQQQQQQQQLQQPQHHPQQSHNFLQQNALNYSVNNFMNSLIGHGQYRN